jgi:hypothetical protein
MDPVLDQNGKILVMFSQRINAFQNIAGFVVTCDLVDPQPPSGNRAEVFYARVPTTLSSEVGSTSLSAGWFYAVRSTLAHELKHIVAFTNRISDFGSILEDSWLEEGSARMAEELWSRRAAYGGLLQGTNATYAQTVFCDLRTTNPAFPQCVGSPLAMLRHFERNGLYDYLRDNELRSPLGPRTGVSEASWYGSAWSLLRWILDNHQVDEATFLTALTRNNQRGVANLISRVGRPWEEILGEWSLALYLDDFPGFTPVNTRIRMPSWNIRSIFSGLNVDRGDIFTVPFPLVPRSATYGDFSVNVSAVAGGSFAMFQLSGAQTGRQLIQLRNLTGGEPSPLLRVAIARID